MQRSLRRDGGQSAARVYGNVWFTPSGLPVLAEGRGGEGKGGAGRRGRGGAAGQPRSLGDATLGKCPPAQTTRRPHAPGWGCWERGWGLGAAHGGFRSAPGNKPGAVWVGPRARQSPAACVCAGAWDVGADLRRTGPGRQAHAQGRRATEWGQIYRHSRADPQPQQPAPGPARAAPSPPAPPPFAARASGALAGGSPVASRGSPRAHGWGACPPRLCTRPSAEWAHAPPEWECQHPGDVEPSRPRYRAALGARSLWSALPRVALPTAGAGTRGAAARRVGVDEACLFLSPSSPRTQPHADGLHPRRACLSAGSQMRPPTSQRKGERTRPWTA